jgi:hypothetical protein
MVFPGPAYLCAPCKLGLQSLPSSSVCTPSWNGSSAKRTALLFYASRVLTAYSVGVSDGRRPNGARKDIIFLLTDFGAAALPLRFLPGLYSDCMRALKMYK